MGHRERQLTDDSNYYNYLSNQTGSRRMISWPLLPDELKKNPTKLYLQQYMRQKTGQTQQSYIVSVRYTRQSLCLPAF